MKRTPKDLVTYYKNKAQWHFENAQSLRYQASENDAARRAYIDAAEALEASLEPEVKDEKAR